MTICYIVAPGWEKMPTAHSRPSSKCDPCKFTHKDYPGMPFPTVVTACPQSGDYVMACQNWHKGHFGLTDPQVITKEAPSGLATVESFTSPGRFLHAEYFKNMSTHLFVYDSPIFIPYGIHPPNDE